MTSAPHSNNPVLKFVSLAYDFFVLYFFPCMQFPSVFGANAQAGSRLREKTEVTEEREDNCVLLSSLRVSTGDGATFYLDCKPAPAAVP